jgi:hypothetical protein
MAAGSHPLLAAEQPKSARYSSSARRSAADRVATNPLYSNTLSNSARQDLDADHADDRFGWRFATRGYGRGVPPEIEQQAAGFYEREDHDRAAAVFRLLIDAFPDYADGHGLVYDESNKLVAVEFWTP